MQFRTLNPVTEELKNEYPFLDNNTLHQKLNNSIAAFKQWRSLSFEDRKLYFLRLADLLEDQKDKHAEAITREMGKPIKQAVGEIEKCAWVCRHYAGYAESFLTADYKNLDSTKESIIDFQPLGVIYAVMPWNFPYWQFFRFAAPALMAGNVALLKHAPNVPESASNIEQLFRQTGFPENVCQNLYINFEQSDWVIQQPSVQGVTLTGSTVAGSHVASVAGKYIKKTVLELGGSDPFIVLDDADVEKAAQTAAKARLQNTGQSCIAAKRFIIQSPVFKKFTEAFKEAFSEYNTGDPFDQNTNLGPLAREDLLDKLDRQVKDSVSAGAEIVTGGNRLKGKGYFYEPTILTNIKPGMPAYEEELFGPVATVIDFNDDQDAVKLANDTQYGLGTAVWTGNEERGKALSREIFTGNVAINGMVKSDPRLPFGGVKKSGYGRELSEYGIMEFVNIKTVNVF